MTIPDTHTHIKALIQAGFTEAQAEAQVRIWLDWIRADLATKQDLQTIVTELRQELRQEITAATTQITTRVNRLAAQFQWLLGLFLVQLGLMITLIGLILV